MNNKFVVIDLETTGHSPEEGDRIMEIGIVVIKNDQIMNTFSTVVHPQKTIPTFISNLTGITDEDVANAPKFSEKASEIVALFENAYFIAHNVPFDLRFLNEELQNNQLKPLTNPILDTVELSRILYPQAGGYKLNQLASYLKIEHDEPHRARSDANVTAKLFLKLKKKLEHLPYETLNHLLTLEEFFHSDLRDLLLAQTNQLSFSATNRDDIISFQGLAFKSTVERDQQEVDCEDSYGHLLDEIYERNGKMQQMMADYENRSGQREISETIYDAFQVEKHAIIEAGTGLGKSIAYLIPAIYQAVKANERIVISSYTTQLQAQLLYEEIPFVQKLIPFPFNVTLLKGKHHYISLEKFAHELAETQVNDNYDTALTKAIILVWLTETKTGDIDEIQLPSSGYFFYNQVNTKSEEKLDPTSPWFRYSYYQQARSKASQSQVIITNHALLCTDLFNEQQFIPSYDKVIIDEAHHFEHAASKQNALSLDHIMLQYSLNQIGKTDDHKWMSILYNIFPSINQSIPQEQWNEKVEQAKYEVDCLFEAIYIYVMKRRRRRKATSDTGRIQYRLDDEANKNASWDGIKEIASRVTNDLKKLIETLRYLETSFFGESLSTKHYIDDVIYFTELFETFIYRIQQFFHDYNTANHVRWIEIEGDGTIYLYREVTDVSTYLAPELFTKKASVILTSATLTIKNSYSYMCDRLGLSSDQIITKQLNSPFNFAEQVQFLVPNDFPNIVHEEQDFIFSTSEAIASLAQITKGRILVLFTSYHMLRKSYDLLKETIDQDQYMLIAQGISSGSRARLKKSFQSFSNSILLGTSSFWEGVDIPGEDLSCLIIARLPFQPPTQPIYEAKAQQLKNKGENPFFKLSLPDAVIRFKQGFGRLIRSKKDRGIVFVCDNRIVMARYGSFFTKSIPNLSVTFDSTYSLMKKAEQWF